MAAKETFEQWLERVAEIKPWVPSEGAEPIDMYVSRLDGGYLCFSNLTKDIRWLFNAGITEQIQKVSPDGVTCMLGFNPEKQKWFGWSHRAYYGFGIGHEVKSDQAGYEPDTADAFREWAIKFWTEEDHLDVTAVENESKTGVIVTWTYSDTIQEPELRGKQGGTFMDYPATWGRGEWKAESLEDAKLMAIAFANSVS